MGQPNPPGDIPLVEGLDASWNEFVSAIPEEQRATLGPKLKERISSYEPLKQWEDLQKSGITPEHASTALNIYSTIENNPRQVYDTLAKYLNITPAQAEQVVEELEDADQDDPRIQALQQQVEVLSQIQIAQRQQTTQEKLAEEYDAKVDAEIAAVKSKYGDDVDEDEIVMRMLHKNMTAEEAYQEYSGKVSAIRKTRPSPMLLGGGGVVPTRAVDPTKLNSKETKDLVAQMLLHAKEA